MMLWRSLRSRPKGLPAFWIVFRLLIVALASRGSAGGIAFGLLMIFVPLLVLRSRAFAFVALLGLLKRR